MGDFLMADKKEYVNIAIDGPAGAGKSTISRLLAGNFGYVYVDTGALYRSIGLSSLKNGVDTADEQGVVNLLSKISLELKFENGSQHVYLNGEDVSSLIRSPEVSMAASKVSSYPEVRGFLLGLQKDIASKNNVVMDGRDIGTVVLPNAKIKIFLTASPEDRAKRRYEEMLARGEKAEYEKVLADIIKRDKADSGRKIAPLKPADDAIKIDTTGFELEKSVQKITSVVEDLL